MSDNRTKAWQTLTRYLKTHDWTVEQVRETSYKAERPGELVPLFYYFQIPDEVEQFLFFIVPQLNLLPDMLAGAAEYVCRANAGLRIGNWDVNFRNGQVSFKSSINFEGVELTESLIDNVIQPALTAFDEFLPGLAEVIAGTETPPDAIRKAEYRE